MHKNATKMFEFPEVVVGRLLQIGIDLEKVRKDFADLLTISIGGRSQEQAIEHSINVLEEQKQFVADTIEYLETGVEADVRRDREIAKARRIKREALPGDYTIVRKGPIKRGDLMWWEDKQRYEPMEVRAFGVNVMEYMGAIVRKRKPK